MRKSLVIFALLLIAVAVIAAGVYMYWKASPKYSLLQAARAVQNHDKAAFEKYVDIGGVMDGVITGAMQYAVKTAPPEDAQKTQMSMGFMTFLKPSIIELMKTEILKSVESGNFGPADKNSAAKNLAAPDMTGGLAAAQPDAMKSLKNLKKDSVQYVKIEGNVASAGLKIDGVKDIPVVELLMRKQDGYWQIFGIGNLDEFFKKAAENKAAADKTVAQTKRLEAQLYSNTPNGSKTDEQQLQMHKYPCGMSFAYYSVLPAQKEDNSDTHILHSITEKDLSVTYECIKVIFPDFEKEMQRSSATPVTIDGRECYKQWVFVKNANYTGYVIRTSCKNNGQTEILTISIPDSKDAISITRLAEKIRSTVSFK